MSGSSLSPVSRTSRGFAVARGFDRYGQPYSIQDSSLATEACIWLGSDDKDGGRAHLTQADAAALIPLLQAFVEGNSIAHQLTGEAQQRSTARKANEGPRAAIDRITHEALPLAASNDLAVVDRARVQVKIAEGVLALVGEGALAGYVEAFYATAGIAGIGTAQPISPREMWETQLRPKLEAAFAGHGDEATA